MSSLSKAEVVSVEKVETHPNADRLDIAWVSGFPVVIGRGTYKEGDLGVYLPADLIPSDEPEFEFLPLEKRKKRIKAIKLRGIMSCGLLVKPREHHKLGDDVTEELKITKWEPPIEKLSTYSGVPVRGPEGEVKYTDIDSLRKYKNLIQPYEDVIITEKIHGCLDYLTRITLSDGSKIKIGNIVKDKRTDLKVLSVDDRGNIVESQILNVFDNGKSDEWLSVKTERRGAGGGNHYGLVRCTPNHKFWNGKDYIEAGKLSKGDNIYVLRTDYGLMDVHKQVILGKLLGDGSYVEIKNSAHIQYSHKEDHKEYCEWTATALNGLMTDKIDEHNGGYSNQSRLRYRTHNSYFIKEKFKSFIKNGKKIVPKWVEKEITPIAIAFWYMDDGSLTHSDTQEDRCSFATCGFTISDCNILIKSLHKFNIDSKLTTYDYPRIVLNADNAEKLFLLIAPYITKCMQYKLPERYRNHSPWLPNTEKVYKKALVKQKVISVTTDNKNLNRYDIETEHHNYFANGILVHNCNSRFVYQDGKLHIGSRTRWIDTEEESSIWERIALQSNLEEKLKKHENFIFFGETYGNVQDLRYNTGKGEVLFRVFDIYDIAERKYLNWGDFRNICHSLSLEVVPILYDGQWLGYEEFKLLGEGQSTIADHIKEGFVVKPKVERYDYRLGRIILKYVGDGYLLR